MSMMSLPFLFPNTGLTVSQLEAQKFLDSDMMFTSTITLKMISDPRKKNAIALSTTSTLNLQQLHKINESIVIKKW